MPKFKLNKPLTKRGFEKLLTKASQPLSESHRLDSKVRGTKAGHLSDGYNGKHKNPNTLEDKEGLPND